MTGGEVVHAALVSSITRFRDHEAGVREGRDPEDVHQARVATRRLRSDLRTFTPLLDPLWAGALGEDLRWLADDLGAVRDADVLENRLRTCASGFAEADRPAAELLVKRLGARRDEARDALATTMDSARYRALRGRLDAATEVIPMSPDASRPAAATLVPLARRRWRRLRAAVRDQPGGRRASDEELHRIRIRAKRCRYAAEAVVPVVGKPAQRFARRVADVQGVLGDQHDAVVAIAWLENVKGDAGPDEIYVAGELATLQRINDATMRRRFDAVWRRLDRKKLRNWM